MNNSHENLFDLVIVGGGAAGIMAALSAKKHHPQYKIILVDRTFALGRKILVCGAGRCNITNLNLHTEIETRYHGGRIDLIRSVFNQFGYQDILNFFQELGVELYIERKTDIGKLFPVTNEAKSIVSMLEDELRRQGITIRLNTEVISIKSKNNAYLIQTENIGNDSENGQVATLEAKYLILSAGGKTYPALGSNGSGYKLAEELGHNIVTPVPSALPLESENQLSKLLQGQKIEAELTSQIGNELIKSRTDEIMFTKYGISGPATLNISREISIFLNRNQGDRAEVTINFFPQKNISQVESILAKRWASRPSQSIEQSLVGIFPTKFSTAFCQVAEINPHKTASKLTHSERTRLLETLVASKVIITKTRGWNEAEFTAGGIDSKEIMTNTLESKISTKLYLAGELIDVDGDVGGFNLSWAWSSGWVTGKLQ